MKKSKSQFDTEPNYKMLARQFTNPRFDANKLGDAIAALASEKPVDYPALYTPGWLVELAKKMQSQDKAAKQAEYYRRHFSFCDGLFPIRFSNTENGTMANCWIGGRRFTLDLVSNMSDDGGHECTAVIKDNGKVVVTIETQKGKATSGHVAFAAFKKYVMALSGSGKHSSRGGFLKTAAKRALAAKDDNNAT